MSDRRFFHWDGRRWEESFVRVGVVTMETMSNHSYYSLYTEVHKSKILYFFVLYAKQTFRSLSLPLCEHWSCYMSEVGLLRPFSLCPPFPKLQGWGNRDRKNQVVGVTQGLILMEDAADPVWSCCFVPLQSAEIAQINLLFAWLGQYVCVLCACVWKCLLSSLFPFILIECSGVTTDECTEETACTGFSKGCFSC